MSVSEIIANALANPAHGKREDSDSDGDFDFVTEFKSSANDYVYTKYSRIMPKRLVDTYTGFVLDSYEIISLLLARWDYESKAESAAVEAQGRADDEAPNDEEEEPGPSPAAAGPSDSGGSKFKDFDVFAAEFLAFAMFSHRWRTGEPTFDDVKGKSIYALTRPEGIRKLQEFCCTAAKCGYRWAWSDTCCIDGKDFAERSEAINSMFLWYSSSDLTIVFLDDVGDVKAGQLPPMDSASWFRDPEIRDAVPPSSPPSPINADGALPNLSLHDRLLDRTYPKLRSMQPDVQIEKQELEHHLKLYFGSEEDLVRMGVARKKSLPIWVTRGWTLQEMLASKRLRFYSRKWTLLEEAEDRDTEGDEARISVSSFKCRARLVDHRANYLWQVALENTTSVSKNDLANFRIGAKDVRSRLTWAAKRKTTKTEDVAYCLLGIFDVSLPAMYGEGPRAFLRLQEEIMKRTGDDSLFDWCGQSSSVNSFLACDPQCYLIPSLPEPVIDDSNQSIFRMILSLLRDIFGIVNMAWSEVKAATHAAMTWISDIMKTPPPGHTLVNGELHVSVFEHRVRRCERLKSSEEGDRRHYYRLEVDGLVDTKVVLATHDPGLIANPKEYYLCRTWHRYNENIFQIVLEFIKYVFKDAWGSLLDSIKDDDDEIPEVQDEADVPGSRLREEMQAKRKAVMAFFRFPFPVYLVRVKDGRGVRVCTEDRVETVYKAFDFTMPVVTRAVL